MGNKVNYILAINFINLTARPRKPQKQGRILRFLPMNFHGCISFVLSQNAYHALILDHLQIVNIDHFINRYRNVNKLI